MLFRANKGHADAWMDARPLVAVVEIAARMFSVTVEVFLRRNFGERYLSGPVLVGGALAVHLVTTALAGRPLLEPRGASLGAMLYLWAYASLCVGHKLVIWRRDRTGERWHSLSDGTSRRLFDHVPIAPRIVQMYVEPALVAVVGLALLLADRVLGGYLLLASLAFLVKGQMTHRRRREAWLDYVDKTIEAEELHAALVEERPARETRGFVVASGAARHQRSLEHMERVLRRTDPELLALGDPAAKIEAPAASPPGNGSGCGGAEDAGAPRHEQEWAQALAAFRKRRRGPARGRNEA
ncbi:MAG: hypothetical protein HY812_07115 [Planctomycetes bacterium]|nr:hypothetical protein [Planctomycetota bacterium]